MTTEQAMSTTAPTRPIRVLVAKPGLDGHDVGAKLICRALTDAGMHAVYTGLRRSPDEIADAALVEDAEVIGLSILSGAHMTLCRKVRDALVARGLGDRQCIVGGNVPAADHAALAALGVAAVFNTGTPFETIVAWIHERIGR